MKLLMAKGEAKELAKLSQELTQCAVLLNLEISVGAATAQKDPKQVDAQIDYLWTRMKQLTEAESEFLDDGSCSLLD